MSDDSGSAAPTEATVERAGFRLRTYVLLGIVVLLAAELGTYFLWGDKAAAGAALRQLPEINGRDFICFLSAGTSPAQKAAVTDALKARFKTVYGHREEIPPDKFVWAKSSLATRLGLDGGFLWSWIIRERGWLWFTAEFGHWQSGPEAVTQRATFVWAFATWVRVSSSPAVAPQEKAAGDS